MVLGGALAAAAICARRGRVSAACRALQPLVGLIVIMAFAYAMSTNRRAIDRRTVAWGLSLQLLFALLVLKTTVGQRVFQTLGGADQPAARASRSSDRASCSARSATRSSGRGS